MEKPKDRQNEELKDTKNSQPKEQKETEQKDYQEEYNKLKEEYLRLYAEFDNYRKRILKEIEDAKESAKRSVINDFLTILDNLEKAIEMAYQHKDAIIEGIELSIKSFKDMLKKHGVEEISPEKENFDPNLHDALMTQPSDELPKDTVIQTVQKGYIYKDKLIRPAKVIVSAGSANNENQNNNDKEE
ncbi:nucleotide exchange factor GrpE [Hippea maritima]|uniref:Protein GrpE n=1 Tax=Hippea maritima (strain ATCC 700847 / DSM 10411 / MH2) TaxID=760142 RepID=F2LUD0_HIPMA|nr:nucleotide exchange factor GrpE [Hippea maritima]AEA33456.1 Protein grpE [Hippea maritima DSM 10411]